MKKILIIGAGRSSSSLIKYLINESSKNNWYVNVADRSIDVAQKLVANSSYAKAVYLDINDKEARNNIINDSDIVISMLPAALHILVAQDCIVYKKDLVTASYVSKEIAALNNAAKEANIILLNEIGLDPGIDHMSAMRIIDNIKNLNGELTSFKSYCGGLIHPEYDNNPWNYKFTWNPRNVVLAGRGVAQYIDNNKIKFIPYNQLFKQFEDLEILDLGFFEAYANRDSLSYRKAYKIDNIPTLLRGTVRKKGFCKSWDIFIKLGLTDDSYQISNSDSLTYKEYINLFLPKNNELSIEENFCKYLSINTDSEEFKKMKWLDLFSSKKINIKSASPAQILQKILEEKWTLSSNDKDMVVMKHEFEYFKNGNCFKVDSSLVVYGDTPVYTAMAKTVGLPVAIATSLILKQKIKSKGVQIPTIKEIYKPILKELENNGINFIENEYKI